MINAFSGIVEGHFYQWKACGKSKWLDFDTRYEGRIFIDNIPIYSLRNFGVGNMINDKFYGYTKSYGSNGELIRQGYVKDGIIAAE